MLRGKAGQQVFLSVVIGLIYLRIGDDLASVQDRQVGCAASTCAHRGVGTDAWQKGLMDGGAVF